MLKALPFIIVLFSACAYADKKDVESVFVIAYPLEARFSEKNCDDFMAKEAPPGYINICMDAVLELKFEVGEVLYGDYRETTINVIDFVHSGGFPEYLTETAIYLALIKEGDFYFLSRTAVLRDVGEEEWVCGEDLNPFVKDNSPQAPPYSKAETVTCAKGIEVDRMKGYLKSNSWKKRSELEE